MIIDGDQVTLERGTPPSDYIAFAKASNSAVTIG